MRREIRDPEVLAVEVSGGALQPAVTDRLQRQQAVIDSSML